MTIRWQLTAAVLLSIAGPATAAEPVVLAPASPWTLDYDTDSCALRRLFGEGDNQVYLEFRRFQPGVSLQTTIASNGTQAKKSPNPKYRIGAEAEWRDGRPANSVVMDSGFSGVIFNPLFFEVPEFDEMDELEQAVFLRSAELERREREAFARIETISLRGVFDEELTIRLGPLDKAVGALNECIDELMTHWDIDVEAHRSLTRPAMPVALGRMSTLIDYPPKMIERRMPGLVNVRLSIDETGQVASCHIQMPLSDPAFEESSCRNIQRSLEFKPALDSSGQPIRSYWVTKVYFRLG